MSNVDDPAQRKAMCNSMVDTYQGILAPPVLRYVLFVVAVGDGHELGDRLSLAVEFDCPCVGVVDCGNGVLGAREASAFSTGFVVGSGCCVASTGRHSWLRGDRGVGACLARGEEET